MLLLAHHARPRESIEPESPTDVKRSHPGKSGAFGTNERKAITGGAPRLWLHTPVTMALECLPGAISDVDPLFGNAPTQRTSTIDNDNVGHVTIGQRNCVVELASEAVCIRNPHHHQRISQSCEVGAVCGLTSGASAAKGHEQLPSPAFAPNLAVQAPG